MADTLHIRDARPDEREAIRALTLAAYQEHAAIMAPTSWAGLSQAVEGGLATTEPAERIVAEHNGELVGSVMLYPPNVNAYGDLAGQQTAPELRLLAVASSARRLGVGKALTAECVRRARRAGASALGLHTSDSLRAATQMYLNLGFVRDPSGDFFPNGNEVVKAYRLALDGAE